MLETNVELRTATLSVLRNERWMGKIFYCGHDGSIHKQSNGLFTNGRVKQLETPSSIDLTKLVKALEPTDALCLGVPKGDIPSAAVTSRHRSEHLRKNGINCITRTKEYFAFPEGEGWLLIDYDDKGIPESIHEAIEAHGGVFQILLRLWPQLKQGDFVIKPSSSAGVHLPGTHPSNSTGFHMFVRLRNASQVPKALQALHARCWDCGLGYHLISKSGQQLDRSIIDVSVGSPERLIFTADPILLDGIQRVPVETIQNSGVAIDGPSLPISAAWTRARDIDRQNGIEGAKSIRDNFIGEQTKRHVEEYGATLTEARAIVRSRIRGRVLSDHDVLDTAANGLQTVGDILDTLKPADVVPCADPIEGREYNPTAASVIWQFSHKHPALVSHANGMQTVYQFARCVDWGNRHG